MSSDGGSKLRLWRSNSSTGQGTIGGGGGEASTSGGGTFSSLFRTSSKTSTFSVEEEDPNNLDSTSEGHLSASSSKFQITLSTITQSREFSPGGIIAGSLQLRDPSILSKKDAHALRVVLVGKCGATVLGKTKWQAAMTVNALGGGTTIPVTYREIHTFLRQTQDLWTAEGENSQSNLTGRYEFEIQVPRVKSCSCHAATYNLPPNIDLRGGENAPLVDRSSVQVYYTLVTVLERKGKFKRDTKLKIPLNLVENTPPNYALREERAKKVRGPLKYANPDTSKTPGLECQLAFTPPTCKNGEIPYRVTYRLVAPTIPYDGPPAETVDENPDGSPPTYLSPLPTIPESTLNALFARLSPKFEVALLRRCLTRAVEEPENGQEWSFPSYVLVEGKSDARTESQARSQAEGVITGTIKVPKDEVSVYTCGAEVKHAIGVRVLDSQLLRPIHVKCDVYLPSSGM